MVNVNKAINILGKKEAFGLLVTGFLLLPFFGGAQEAPNPSPKELKGALLERELNKSFGEGRAAPANNQPSPVAICPGCKKEIRCPDCDKPKVEQELPSQHPTAREVLYLDGNDGYYEEGGKTIVLHFYKVGKFSEGLAWVRLGPWDTRYGYVDTAKKVVVYPTYDYAESFSEGLAAVILNDKCGYINTKGKVVIPIQYAKCRSFSEGLAWVSDIGDGPAGRYINPDGVVQVWPDGLSLPLYRIKEFGDFSDGLAKVILQDNKAGFINRDGRLVIGCKYTEATAFNKEKHRAAVRIDGNFYDDYFLIDRFGAEQKISSAEARKWGIAR